jgi:hypothetical protein
MEVKDILAAAAQAVDEANVPEALREAAFVKAVDLLAGKAPVPHASLVNITGTGQFAGEMTERVAQRLRVNPAAVAEAFDFAGDDVSLILAPSRLPRQKAAAMRDVALLITAARQAAGIDSDGWTESEVIREACRNIGVFDSANFATEIGHMGNVFSFKGSGRNRVIKANLRGLEQAGVRLVELTEGS